MKVYKEETSTGTIQSITFRADNEQQDAFKATVKSWIAANYPAMTWEQFINRLVVFEAGRITISML